MTDHIQKTRDMIAVMQAYVDGAEIEMNPKFSSVGLWKIVCVPSWNWNTIDYRVSTTKDSIDWSHVSPEWKFMARDKDGVSYLYGSKPEPFGSYWRIVEGRCIDATLFASYRRGNCDWRYSLVRRPE